MSRIFNVVSKGLNLKNKYFIKLQKLSLALPNTFIYLTTYLSFILLAL